MSLAIWMCNEIMSQNFLKYIVPGGANKYLIP
jgi:hypothetical protein